MRAVFSNRFAIARTTTLAEAFHRVNNFAQLSIE
jgi:hypothetical protein